MLFKFDFLNNNTKVLFSKNRKVKDRKMGKKSMENIELERVQFGSSKWH